ncbi:MULTISPECIES: septal ring lytic transglycosylase RlpA family protein [Pseudomonas]|uniref:septal ring lytic transglycosylase RlpA family protein n=1 Tax=Pseudomonas TaxID=286 RepID=UPI0023053C7D|nr:septal ring lytic transglycosylase RlpA family protein [Pseudomonas sp. TUM22785]WCD81593.1 septal ring lytic transglycosylase RlpA family protein [Pseudomonas sp. TUM22785]
MQRLLCLLAFSGLLTGCSYIPFERDSETPGDYRAEGRASFYGARHHGQKTASGERFDQNALTAAHRTLPFGTRVKVTNLNNDRSVVLRINDRGPYARTRIIDVSKKAAEELGMIRSGVVPVRVESLR